VSGYDVLRALRISRVKTPILILSGLNGVNNKVKGLAHEKVRLSRPEIRKRDYLLVITGEGTGAVARPCPSLPNGVAPGDREQRNGCRDLRLAHARIRDERPRWFEKNLRGL
jgi:hypothetical protein